MSRKNAASPAVRLERQLTRVRWFGVVFGLYQIYSGYRAPGSLPMPAHVRSIGYLAVAGLGIVNLLTVIALPRLDDRGVRRLGLIVFISDCTYLFGIVWLYTFDPTETTWVTLTILAAEGAFRYRLVGALIPAAIAAPMEVLRELYRFHSHITTQFYPASVTYRVGIVAILGAITGIMARSLERERVKAETRARELDAFHQIVLAGVAGDTKQGTLDSVVETMGRTLGYECFAIGLVEDVDGTRLIRCAGAYGFTHDLVGRTMPIDAGICGRAIATGEAQLVHNTAHDADYVPWEYRARSELSVPIYAHERLIGVLDVESMELGRFTLDDADRLKRLGPQIGMIIASADLLAQERATVERMRELDTMKSDFIAITSHELRTPLTSISGFIKTMRRPNLDASPEEIERMLAVVDRQTDRLKRLVEDLLVVAGIDSGALQVLLERVEIDHLISETLRELGDGAERVDVHVQRGLRYIVTDAQRLGQIMRNLLENALKFSDASSGVRLTVEQSQRLLVVKISDHGSGIPANELEHIFDRFHQVDGALIRSAGGVGLGLYITRGLVSALQGSIDVESEVGGGTTFRLELPVAGATLRDVSAPARTA